MKEQDSSAHSLLNVRNPPRVVPYGSKAHPMYQQWLKMIDSCVDPEHKLYAQVGAKGITLIHRWFNFQDFVQDNENLFEYDSSKDANLRRNFIRRKDLLADFGPENIEWVTKKEAIALQPNTICVDTYFGRNMPIKELERVLIQRTGEDLPLDAPVQHVWESFVDSETGKSGRRLVRVATVRPIKLHILRKRAREGMSGWDLLAPVRDYGNNLDQQLHEVALPQDDRPRNDTRDEQQILSQMKQLADELAAHCGTSIAVVLIKPTAEGYEHVEPQLVMEEVCYSSTGTWPQGFSLTLLNESK